MWGFFCLIKLKNERKRLDGKGNGYRYNNVIDHGNNLEVLQVLLLFPWRCPFFIFCTGATQYCNCAISPTPRQTTLKTAINMTDFSLK